MNTQQTGNKMDEQEIQDERRALVEAQLRNGLFLDKWLLSISAGVFGLSVAFIRDIVGSGSLVAKPMLVISWASFCGCIITTLVCYLLSYPAYSRQIEIFEKDLKDVNCYRDWMKGLNIAAVVLFSVAVTCLAIFATLNL